MHQDTFREDPNGLLYRVVSFEDGTEEEPFPELPIIFDVRMEAEVFGNLYTKYDARCVEVVDRPLIVLVDGAPTRTRVVYELREAR